MLFYNVIYDLYRGFNPNNPYAPPGDITVACELNGELVHHVRHGRFGTGKYLHWTNVLLVPEETDIRSAYNSQLNAFNAGNADTVIVHDYPIPGWYSAFLVVDVQVMTRGLAGVYRRCYLDRARPKKGMPPFCEVGIGGLPSSGSVADGQLVLDGEITVNGLFPELHSGQIILVGTVNANGPPPATISLKDTFTDTNGVPLTSHVMNVGSGWSQQSWTNTGVWYIESNSCRLVSSDTTAPDDYLLWADNHASDTTTSVQITAVTLEAPGGIYLSNISGPGVIFRFQDPSNHWLLAFGIIPAPGANTFYCELYYKSAGSYVLVSSASLGSFPNTPFPVSIVCSGSSIKCYVFGGLVLQTTNSFLSTATSYGFREAIQGGSDPQQTCFYNNFLVTTP